MHEQIRQILKEIGEDPARDGLLKTPQRVDRAFRYLTSGYKKNPEELLNGALFQVAYDEMVIVRDIDVFSLCEHHLLPFVGMAHVAYLPERSRLLGLSKLARIVELYAKRLQLQERLTTEIADAIMRLARPRGALCIIEAEHLCMTMRGVKKPGARTVTSALRGIFRENPATRSEVMALIYSRPR